MHVITLKTFRSRTSGPELVAEYFAKALEALQLLFSIAASSNAVRRNQDRKPLPIADGSQLPLQLSPVSHALVARKPL